MERDIIAGYNQRIAAAQQQVNKYKKLVDTYSFTRLGAFLLLLVLAVVSAVWVNYIMLSISVFAFILVFGWLVSKQNKYDAQLLFLKALK